MTTNSVQDKKIAVMSNDIAYIKERANKIESKLDILIENYVTREELQSWFERMHEESDKRFEGVNKRVNENRELAEKATIELTLFKSQVKTGGAVVLFVLGIVQWIISQYF